MITGQPLWVQRGSRARVHIRHGTTCFLLRRVVCRALSSACSGCASLRIVEDRIFDRNCEVDQRWRSFILSDVVLMARLGHRTAWPENPQKLLLIGWQAFKAICNGRTNGTYKQVCSWVLTTQNSSKHVCSSRMFVRHGTVTSSSSRGEKSLEDDFRDLDWRVTRNYSDWDPLAVGRTYSGCYVSCGQKKSKISHTSDYLGRHRHFRPSHETCTHHLHSNVAALDIRVGYRMDTPWLRSRDPFPGIQMISKSYNKIPPGHLIIFCCSRGILCVALWILNPLNFSGKSSESLNSLDFSTEKVSH